MRTQPGEALQERFADVVHQVAVKRVVDFEGPEENALPLEFPPEFREGGRFA